MAIRKSTAQAQVNEAMRTLLEPGEQLVASVYSIAGSSPMLKMSFGALSALFVKFYWVCLTDRRFIVLNVRKASGRPGEVVSAQLRSDIRVTGCVRRPVWSSFTVHGPLTQNGLRLNVHRMWRAEFDQLTSAVGVPSGP
jgi:hypothetical protein